MYKRKISVCILIVLLLLCSTACTGEKTAKQEQAQKEVEQEQKKNTEIPKETTKEEPGTKEETVTKTPTQTPVSKKATRESENRKKKERVKLNHTYKTRLREVDKVDCPTFQFKYSDNWKIVKEETNRDSWSEQDVLKNDRGATITYTDYGSIYGLGNEGRFMFETKFSKVADSRFVPSYVGTDGERSDIGPCMVAKVKTVGELYMDTDTDFTKIDGGVVYAVVPESYTGIHSVVGMSGLYTECSFEYGGLYSLLAEAPDGEFTEEEEKEVIEILSSFREVY